MRLSAQDDKGVLTPLSIPKKLFEKFYQNKRRKRAFALLKARRYLGKITAFAERLARYNAVSVETDSRLKARDIVWLSALCLQ